jgi:hypothetical protein
LSSSRHAASSRSRVRRRDKPTPSASRRPAQSPRVRLFHHFRDAARDQIVDDVTLIFYSWKGAASRNALASLGWISKFAYRCSATFLLILLDLC